MPKSTYSPPTAPGRKLPNASGLSTLTTRVKVLSASPVPVSSTVTCDASSAWMVTGPKSMGPPVASTTKSNSSKASLPAASVTMMRAVCGPAARSAPITTKSPSASALSVTSIRVAPPSKLISILTMSSSSPPTRKLIEAAWVSFRGSAGPSSSRSPSTSALVSEATGPVPAGVISIRSTFGPAVVPAASARVTVFWPAARVTVWVRKAQLLKPFPAAPSASVSVDGKVVVAAVPLTPRSRTRGLPPASCEE